MFLTVAPVFKRMYDLHLLLNRLYSVRILPKSRSFVKECLIIIESIDVNKTADINSAFPQTNYTVMSNADNAKILGKMKEFNTSISVDAAQLSEKQFQNMNDLLNGDIENLEEKMNTVFQTLQWPVGK